MRLRLLRREVLCQQAVELVTDYLEGALPRRARRRFEAHLTGCPHCTEYLAQMRETIRLTGRLTPEDLSPRQRDEFVDLYRRWRAHQECAARTAPARSARRGPPRPPLHRHRQHRPRRRRLPVL